MDRFTTTLRHRAAVTAVFAGNGVLFASLFARLPEVQNRLGLGEGALGLALLAAPAGLIGAVLLAGARVARHGSRRVATVSAAGYAGVLFLPALAPTPIALAAALFALGATSGALDVAMNTQGIAVERGYPRRIFASLHAGFSFGALAGAATGGLAAQAGVPLAPHLLAVGAVIGAVMALSIRTFVADADTHPAASGPSAAPAPPASREAVLALPPRALLPLGAVAFCVLLAEGALNDWSAVYLSRVHGAAPATAAAGLAVFSLAMGGARLAGDRLAAAFGSRAVVRGGLLAGAVGFAAAAAAPGTAAAIVAFGGLGLGLASVYPLLMREAAEHPDVPAGIAIGAVTTLGYVGFLLGPPLVGLLAHAGSLRASLAVVGGLCLLASWPSHSNSGHTLSRCREAPQRPYSPSC